jgi:hypothetical protein
VRELSFHELEAVTGMFGPVGAAIGAAGGAGGYFLENRISHAPWSWTALGSAAAMGAVAGAVTGPAGVVWGFNGALAGGTARGVAQHYGW